MIEGYFKNGDKHATEIIAANVHPNIRKLVSTEIPPHISMGESNSVVSDKYNV